jgi:NCS1 family nucleobase:cation symporter-1
MPLSDDGSRQSIDTGRHLYPRPRSPTDRETSPLLAGPSTEFQRARRHTNDSLTISFQTLSVPLNHPQIGKTHTVQHCSDESYFFDCIMEKVKSTRIAYFVENLAVESEPGLTNAQLMLNNHDLKPGEWFSRFLWHTTHKYLVEPERRQWGPWNFVGFWVADSFNIVSHPKPRYQPSLTISPQNTWMISSSMIVNSGLSWWQSWICVWLGYSIAACFIVLTGRIGSTYHISFPVISRASFGIWGALWPVFNRAAMACIWYGVQAWIGGECVRLMICAIWPSFYNIHNGIPNSGTTTRDFLAFFIFWLCSLPAIWFPVHKIRHLFTVKAYVVPTAG